VLNITDGVNRACFYLEKDDTGRIWATFYPYPPPAGGQLYSSENGTTWTYRGTFTPPCSFDEVSTYNYMEAGVRHFRGKQESRFAIKGGNIRASFDIQAASLNGHSRTDFGDVRFTSSDGTTLLDYWIEEKVDGNYAVFWVEVSEDLGSDRTIYVYYGKSDATTTSNGNNTFPFFDDFSGDLSKWTSLLGTWKIVGGELRSTATDDSLIRSATYQVANARVRTKLRLDTASDYWSPVFRFQDANNFYQIGASKFGPSDQYHRQYKCVGGSFTKIGTEVVFNPAQASHTSTSLAYGSSLKV
jgi:hypothetical protein